MTERIGPVSGALGEEAERAKKLSQLSDIGTDLLRCGKQRRGIAPILLDAQKQERGLVGVEENVLDNGSVFGVSRENRPVQDRSDELAGWNIDDVIQARVGGQAGRRSGVRWRRSRGNQAAEAEE
jgi:hypothetical protein